MCNERSNGGCHWGHHVDENEPKEQYKVFVIAVAQTIIDIDAVMIKFLHTPPTYHTVKSPGWLDNLAVEAEILKINIPVMTDLEQIDNTKVPLDIPRVWAIAYKVENHWQEEKYDS